MVMEHLYLLFADWFPQYFSEYNFPTSLITDRLIESITFDKAQGGTLTLGGEDDTNGVFSLENASGVEIIGMTSSGFMLYDSSANNIVTIDAIVDNSSII